MDPTQERSPRRPAAVLEPRDLDRIDAAGRLRTATSSDRRLPGFATQLDGPRSQRSGPHHAVAPKPNR